MSQELDFYHQNYGLCEILLSKSLETTRQPKLHQQDIDKKTHQPPPTTQVRELRHKCEDACLLREPSALTSTSQRNPTQKENTNQKSHPKLLVAH